MSLYAYFVLISASVYLLQRLFNHRVYPPGPRSLPIIGHLLSIPSKNQHIVFHEWSKQYGESAFVIDYLGVQRSRVCTLGDIIRLKVFRRSLIILNSQEVASDLLEKRCTIYSDRPRFPMLELYVQRSYFLDASVTLSICSMGWTTGPLAFLNYNRDFHDTRKVFQSQLSRQASAVYQESQTRQALILMQNILKSPDKLETHLQRCVFSMGIWRTLQLS